MLGEQPAVAAHVAPINPNAVAHRRDRVDVHRDKPRIETVARTNPNVVAHLDIIDGQTLAQSPRIEIVGMVDADHAVTSTGGAHAGAVALAASARLMIHETASLLIFAAATSALG